MLCYMLRAPLSQLRPIAKNDLFVFENNLFQKIIFFFCVVPILHSCFTLYALFILTFSLTGFTLKLEVGQCCIIAVSPHKNDVAFCINTMLWSLIHNTLRLCFSPKKVIEINMC